jgi:hypothetical protein
MISHDWTSSAADSMQQFAIKRFERGDESSTGITQPSQRRYVEYFQQILDESRKVYSRAVVLKNIIFQEIPNYSSGGGCRIFFKIGMVGSSSTCWVPHRECSEVDTALESSLPLKFISIALLFLCLRILRIRIMQ